MLYHAKRDRDSYRQQQLVECVKQVEQMMAAIGIGKKEVYHHKMSLFPTDDILTKLQQQWKGYADALRQEDKEAFLIMIEKCYAHAAAINAKGEPFPNEALLMSLVFSQYKMINWLVPKVTELSKKITELEEEKEAEKKQ